MCGIVGAWSFNFEPRLLDDALRALAHRGPDGHGMYHDAQAGISMGHARLAIIDLSPAGHQPMLAAEDQVALVFNGEIYNYRELRAELEAQGVAFRGHSDTEVLLHLYLREGLEALSRLNGIFAIAIHDQRTGELLLARDALGVKPLYYSENHSGFSFASEIKAMLPYLSGVGNLDLEALNRYLTYLWCPGEGTLISSVRKLSPGEAMQVKNGRIVRRWAWYKLPARRGVVSHMSEREAIESVRDGLQSAVNRQLVSDVPLGAFLSGGLDSSAIAAFARMQIPELQCFTIAPYGGSDTGDSDDLPYARRVAKHLGLSLEIVEVDSANMADDLERMVWQLDEPLADPAPLNVLYISQLARQRGIRVLLSGSGGDDLFTGYRRHLALRYEKLWSWLPHSTRKGLGRVALSLDQRTAIGRRMGRLFADAAEQGDVRAASYFAWGQHAELASLIEPKVYAEITGTRPDQPILDFLAEIPANLSPIDRMLALEQRFFLADHNLIYTDKMAMAAGVEVRVPFLDLELVEIASRIPDRLKQRGRVGKWVLKKAMEPYLPHDVIYRPKTGFGAPLRRWMRHELREMLGDLLSEQSLRNRGLFNSTAVHRLIADNDAGRRDASYTLLSLLCIEIWCRKFLDGGIHKQVEALKQPT